MLQEKIELYSKLLPKNTLVINTNEKNQSFNKDELLHDNSIDFDEIVDFNNTEADTNDLDLEKSNAGGYTFYFLKNSNYFAVVVINKLLINNIKESGFALVSNIIHLITIIHEYKHAEDALNGLNINLESKTVNRLNFEIEAECKTVEVFVSEINFNRNCIQYLAIRLLNWSQSNNNYKKHIAKGVINKFTRKQMKLWAKLDFDFYNEYKNRIS
jgi:hypothetical protein